MKKNALVVWVVAVVTAVCLASPAAALAAQGSTTYTKDTVNVVERLYNKYTGEHFYTTSTTEKDALVKAGWNDEGVAWYAPKTSSTPVYRLYNPYSGDHHYTTSKDEYESCGKAGWKKEGTGWYSADAATGEVLYRGYNKYATVGAHHYTTSRDEMKKMITSGWIYEGKAWYGVPASQIKG